MHDILHNWAKDWCIESHAVFDLMARLGTGFEPEVINELAGWSESAVSNFVRLEAAKAGIICWRNNVGAWQDPNTNSFVRYGLCNDTAALNKSVKSADLIGIKPVFITREHVGTVIGQFYSREVKEAGWRFTGDAHELAQQKWAQIITSKGGDAAFTTGAI